MKWSDKEKQLLQKFMEEEPFYYYQDLSNRLQDEGYNRSAEAVRKFIRRSSIEASISLIGEEELEGDDASDDSVSLEDLSKLMDSIDREKEHYERIDEVRREYEKIANEKNFLSIGRTEKPEIKILCLSDLHIPFQNDKVVEHALVNHGDADILVLNGDILDMYSVSRWPKHKDVSVQHEFSMAAQFLAKVASKFKKVVLTRGNHEKRMQSYFSAQIDPAIKFMVHTDALDVLAQGYVLDEDGILFKRHSYSNVYYQPGQLCWYIKIGKAIFAHPDKTSSVPGKLLVSSAYYFNQREEFDCLVVGHSHKCSKLINNDRILIEQGCACLPMEYESDGKMAYDAQHFGYALIYMDRKGNVDFDLSRPVYLGTGFPVKTNEINLID